jgi:hypothetical protein
MSKWSMERWAASTGLGFAILLIVSGFLPGSPKKWNASAADIESYLQGKHKEIVVAMILSGVAAILFLWFLASFAGMFREVGQGRLATIMYGAGVATLGVALIGDGIQLALAKVTYTADQGTVAAMYGVGTWLYARLFWTAAALALATWLATKRSKAMPDWYAWLSLLGAVLFVLSGLALRNTGFFSITGAMGFIGFLSFALWIGISSLLLVQRTADAPAAAPAMG